MKKLTRILLLLLLLAGNAGYALAQCPMCKATVESASAGKADGMAAGLNTGILLLFVLPYILGATVGIAFYLRYRRRKMLASHPVNS